MNAFYLNPIIPFKLLIKIIKYNRYIIKGCKLPVSALNIDFENAYFVVKMLSTKRS